MQVFAGDTLVLIAFENLRVDAFGIPTPAIVPFEVTGTFTTGMYDYDTKNVYTPRGCLGSWRQTGYRESRYNSTIQIRPKG